MTYQVGDMKVEVGGRVAELKHVINAHTDGDTWVYFRDANVLALGDTFNRNYPNIDWSNGGGIEGMVLAADRYLKAANDNTKIVPGHGALATKADLPEFRDMLVTARDRVKKLYDEGKTEQQVLAMDPLRRPQYEVGRAAGPFNRAQLPAQRVQLVPQSKLNGIQ